MAVRVELGQMYTPEMGRQRGAVLLRAREREGIVVMLYREDRYYIITVMHIIMTLTSIERVARVAFGLT